MEKFGDPSANAKHKLAVAKKETLVDAENVLVCKYGGFSVLSIAKPIRHSFTQLVVPCMEVV